MQKLIIFSLLFTGCATTKTPSLELLMRESYYVGCGERALQELPKPLIEHDADIKAALAKCAEHRDSFNLNQTGVYSDDLEVIRKTRNTRESAK